MLMGITDQVGLMCQGIIAIPVMMDEQTQIEKLSGAIDQSWGGVLSIPSYYLGGYDG